MNEQSKQDILLKWFNKELNQDDLAAVQADPEFAIYEAIIKESVKLQVPEIEMAGTFEKIQGRIEKNQKAIKLKRRNLLITAALLIFALLIGYGLWPRKLIITSKVGQPMAHLLPDESEVELNANSSIMYDSDLFAEERKLNLNGEAFFNVTHGNSFVVETTNGQIEVLGTSFIVSSRENILRVSCITGKVKVSQNDLVQILDVGDRIRFESGEKTHLDKINPSDISNWNFEESRFSSIPLKDVILALENQYGVDIHIDKALSTDIYTGSFIHSDLQTALEMVFSPMGLRYEFVNKQKLNVFKEN